MAKRITVLKTIDNYVYEGIVVAENKYELDVINLKIIEPQCRKSEYTDVVHFQKSNIIWYVNKSHE
ncbi:MAG: hypothetical protein AB6733_11840 [Clostridiaceae bacterium]